MTTTNLAPVVEDQRSLGLGVIIATKYRHVCQKPCLVHLRHRRDVAIKLKTSDPCRNWVARIGIVRRKVQSGFDKSPQRRDREIRTVGYRERSHIRGAREGPVLLGGHGIEDGIIKAWTLINDEIATIPDTEEWCHILVDSAKLRYPLMLAFPECLNASVAPPKAQRVNEMWNGLNYLVHDPEIVHVLEIKEQGERQLWGFKFFG